MTTDNHSHRITQVTKVSLSETTRFCVNLVIVPVFDWHIHHSLLFVSQ